MLAVVVGGGHAPALSAPGDALAPVAVQVVAIGALPVASESMAIIGRTVAPSSISYSIGISIGISIDISIGIWVGFWLWICFNSHEHSCPTKQGEQKDIFGLHFDLASEESSLRREDDLQPVPDLRECLLLWQFEFQGKAGLIYTFGPLVTD